MQEFLLLFRRPNTAGAPTPEQVKAINEKWLVWLEGLKQQGAVVSNGQRLTTEGKVLKPGGVITDGPFVEIREMLGGFMVIRANSFDEATTLAHGCPAMDTGGSVEIRAFLN